MGNLQIRLSGEMPANRGAESCGALALHAGIAGMLVSAVAGCASLPASEAAKPARIEARSSLPDSADGENGTDGVVPSRGQVRRTPERVVFSDEVTQAGSEGSPTGSGTGAQELAGGFGDGTRQTGSAGGAAGGNDDSLVGALAATYDDDMKALARMQAERDAERSARLDSARTTAVEFEPGSGSGLKSGAGVAVGDGERASEAEANKPVPTSQRPESTTPNPANPTAADRANASPPHTATSSPESASSTTSSPASSPTPPAAATTETAQTLPSTSAPAASAAAGQPPSTAGAVAANGALELPASVAIPTEPAELAALLSDALAAKAGASTHPLHEWLSVAALACAQPEAKLPADFDGGAGVDLLPAERERVRKAHAAFAAIGRALAAGEEVTSSDAEALVAALTGGPKLTLPKVEFCTKIEGFGRFTQLGNDRFLAGSKARFIVYSELAGFTSLLENGAFTTRLATRVSIESDRDGVTVWQRSPEWTAVVDASPTRRDEFFVGEIVTLSEYLTVGGYRLKVEIRDESTGAVATATRPFVVVADPAMAAVAD